MNGSFLFGLVLTVVCGLLMILAAWCVISALSSFPWLLIGLSVGTLTVLFYGVYLEFKDEHNED